MEAPHTWGELGRWYDGRPPDPYERLDGRIVAMAPERAAHVMVKSAVWLALRRAVAEAKVPCQTMANGHHRRSGSGIGTRILVGGAINLDPPCIWISVEEISEAA